jgi:hypothetical protein
VVFDELMAQQGLSASGITGFELTEPHQKPGSAPL